MNQPSSLNNSICGILKAVILTTGLLAGIAYAQYPVPQVVGPPSPQAVKPGGGDFTLKVYGANFVPGAMVNWNRQPRATTYVSGHEVDATILASDIFTNTAGYITVTNPPPEGGTSSTGYGRVEVHEPRTAIKTDNNPKLYAGSHGEAITQLLVGDFNGDGIMDFAVGGNEPQLPILVGDGDGGFTFSHYAAYNFYGLLGVDGIDMAYGDFNGDGFLDLAFRAVFSKTSGGFVVKLGNGDGSFRPAWVNERVPATSFVVGDFDRDGKLDIVTGYDVETDVLLGNGDGTFGTYKKYAFGGAEFKFAGDFNGDGKLDLLLMNGLTISLALGNGDGTFQSPRFVAKQKTGCVSGPNLLVSDFNGDGKLDIALCSDTGIRVMLGNGDGTFRASGFYRVSPPSINHVSVFSFAAGDFNSDGRTDLLVSTYGPKSYTYVLWGNGDGTFQPKTLVNLSPKGTNAALGLAVGDFNSDGLLDFAFQEAGYGFEVYLQQ